MSKFALALIGDEGLELLGAAQGIFVSKNANVATEFNQYIKAAKINRLQLYVDSLDEQLLCFNLNNEAKLKRAEVAALAATKARDMQFTRYSYQCSADKLYLTGLNKQEQLQFWLQLIASCGVAVTAISSLPLSCAQLLTAYSQQYILLAYRKQSGLWRHSLYAKTEHGWQLQLSRLTQAEQLSPCQQLLDTVDYIIEHQGVSVSNVVLLTTEAELDEFKTEFANLHADLTLNFKVMTALAASSASAALLAALYVQQQRSVNHYAGSKDLQLWYLRRYRRYIGLLAMLLLFLSVALLAVAKDSAPKLAKLQQLNDSLHKQYQQFAATHTVSAIQELLNKGASPAKLAAVPAAIDCVQASLKLTPRTALYRLSRIMLQYPQINLTNLLWQRRQSAIAYCENPEAGLAGFTLTISGSYADKLQFDAWLASLRQQLAADIKILAGADNLMLVNGAAAEVSIQNIPPSAVRQFEVQLEVVTDD